MTQTLICELCSNPLPLGNPDSVCAACRAREKPHETRVGTPTREEYANTRTAAAILQDRTATHPGGTYVEPWPVIAGYELDALLGEGGGGRVFRARQLVADRLVAVKVLIGSSQAEQKRFAREIRALAAIRHPHVIPVFEVGNCDAGPFFSMELATGGSLGQRIRAGRIPIREVASIVEQSARGVASAHAAKILHRDLKPGNILLAANDQSSTLSRDRSDGPSTTPKVADFGLAKEWVVDGADSPDGLVTATGAFLGTPSYMAPEQAAGRVSEIGVRTDVYGLGAVLYHALTGSPPFRAESAAGVAHLVLTEPPEPPRRKHAEIPRDLEAVCLKCLEKDPEQRYQSADELADDLARFLRGEPTFARPPDLGTRVARWGAHNRERIGVATLVIAVAVIVTLFVKFLDRPRDPNAELKRIRAELDANKSAVLIKETGLPRWSRWERGGGVFRESGYGDDVCAFEAVDSSYLELLTAEHVPDEFRFRADVRHEQGITAASRAGLFVFYQTESLADGASAYSWHQVCFNDHPPGEVPGFKEPPDLMQYRPVGLQAVPGQAGGEYPGNLAILSHTPPLGMQPRPWRILEIVVRREGVRVRSGESDDKLREFNPALVAMETVVAASQRVREKAREGSAEPNFSAEWKPRGSIGLFLTKGRGSFRNVRIESLSP